jgi:acyl-coenzyme A thioesterase 13
MEFEPSPPLPDYRLYDPVDPFENGAGPFFWRQSEDGSHHFVMLAEARHCNTYGVVHGGLMMTMADLSMAATSKAERSDAYVTVSFNSEFIASGQAGDLIECRSELVRRTGTMAFVRGTVEAGGRTLLAFSGVMKRLRQRTAES